MFIILTKIQIVLNESKPRMTYEEALRVLQNSQKFPKLEFGQDLNAEQERVLVEYMDNIPVFVTHFPSDVKPFYMKRFNEKVLKIYTLLSEFIQFFLKALCFDLLSPVSGEICGGSVREDSLQELENRIIEMKSDDSLNWYENHQNLN